MKTEKIEYRAGDVTFVGYAAYAEESQEKRPAVIVCHDYSGNNDFAHKKAEKLAELGYVGFALDMYGNGKVGATREEKQELIKPFFEDRAKVQSRVLAALETVKKIPVVAQDKIGAIGFCFGGMCALDLARSGADVKGVVSFHGLLTPPDKLPKHTIKAKVLVLHGFDDPMVKPEQVTAFGHEMTEAKVDWELDIYGNTTHAFTNPEANDPKFGTVYSKRADARSWIAMQEFFKEIFA